MKYVYLSHKISKSLIKNVLFKLKIKMVDICMVMVSTFQYFADRSDILFQAFLVTVRLCLYAAVFGFMLGVLASLSKLSTHRILRWPATVYIEIFRGTPLLVQLYVMSFAYPIFIHEVLGVTLVRNTWTNPASFWDATIVLSLNTGAYQAEIIRAGIQSLPVGQTEAARSVGLTHTQSLRYIILPQAFRVVLPPMANEYINLVLNSSLASIIVVRELTYWAKVLTSQSFRTLQIWFVVGGIYFMVTLTLSRTFQYTEKRTRIPGLGPMRN